MSRRSAILASIRTAVEAVDVSSYDQGKVAALAETRTADAIRTGHAFDHLVYTLENQESRPLDRLNGAGDSMFAAFELFVGYQLREGMTAAGFRVDMDLASDLQEDVVVALLAVDDPCSLEVTDLEPPALLATGEEGPSRAGFIIRFQTTHTLGA